MKQFKTGSLSALNAIISGINTELGYPNAETKTDTYSVARKHPTEDTYIASFDNDDYSTPVGGLISYDEAKALGFFPSSI